MKLRVYALYKQATDGDVGESKPGFLDPTGRAKWDARNQIKGMTKEAAMEEYVKAVDEQTPSWRSTI